MRPAALLAVLLALGVTVTACQRRESNGGGQPKTAISPQPPASPPRVEPPPATNTVAAIEPPQGFTYQSTVNATGYYMPASPVRAEPE